jgi:hypothetical protein
MRREASPRACITGEIRSEGELEQANGNATGMREVEVPSTP